MGSTDSSKRLVFSYLEHRKTIGILGIGLPFVVSLGAMILFQTGIQSSISSYYHTPMRDVFVGTLFAIGFFLLSYRGYERTDDIAGDLAFVFAIGMALFPTAPDGAVSDAARIVGNVHVVFAALFFSTLIYFSLFLFTKTDEKKKPTERKLMRNEVYQACGYTMAISLLLIAVYYRLPAEWASLLVQYKPVFWLESLAILAFGASWFTKSEALLKDLD